MKRILIGVIVLLVAANMYLLFDRNKPVIETTTQKKVERPLEKYSYEHLRSYNSVASPIVIEDELKSTEDFTSKKFFFMTNGKKVSGLINLPAGKGPFPVIILIRGFVDPAVYETGVGSERIGEYFARLGYITLSPDFLGYGTSDKAATDAFEDRFLTYTTVLDLMKSVENSDGINSKGIEGVWGHSNGGQIALTVAEISRHTVPTVLWAPVTKPFPYSILYFTDEFDDRGKALRRVLAQFEQLYDVEKYSLTNYIDWINAPLQIHQGTNDEEVPEVWNSEFASLLKEKNKDVEYFTYPGENHNFNRGSFELAASRSAAFFQD